MDFLIVTFIYIGLGVGIMVLIAAFIIDKDIEDLEIDNKEASEDSILVDDGMAYYTESDSEEVGTWKIYTDKEIVNEDKISQK